VTPVIFREPSSIVDMAEATRQALRHMRDRRLVKGDDALIVEGALESFPKAQFFELGADVIAAVDDLYKEMFSGRHTDEIRVDIDAKLPADVCLFWGPGTRIDFGSGHGPLPTMYMAAKDAKDGVTVLLVSPYVQPLPMGLYTPGVAGGLQVQMSGDEQVLAHRASQVLTVAAMCSVINQPGFLKKEPAGSRQERRAATRAGGYAPEAWQRITWNIGEHVKAKLSREDGARCMPLHYTRGHWRKAEEGWKNSERRKDGLWYQWIEGYWSGHPAFGIKRSFHAPRMAG